VIPKVGFGKLLRDFTAFIIMINGRGWHHVLCIILLGFIGYYFSAASVLKEFFCEYVFDANFVVISVSAGLFEKNYAVNERPAIVFADKTEVKSEAKIKDQK
jgi:hypothetical protein